MSSPIVVQRHLDSWLALLLAVDSASLEPTSEFGEYATLFDSMQSVLFKDMML
jgi:hypothetical protein